MGFPLAYTLRNAVRLLLVSCLVTIVALFFPFGLSPEKRSTTEQFIYNLNILKLNLTTLFDRSASDRKTLTDYDKLIEFTTFNVRNFLRYYQYINAISDYYDLDPELVRSLIIVESRFNIHAESHKGALGLMQLMPTTAQELGYKNITDPHKNISAGCKYLRRMLDRFNGDLKLSLAAYNAGPGAVLKHGSIPPYAETQNYVEKVLKIYKLTNSTKK